MSNKNLSDAKKAKNDEFYTRMNDICDELYYYRDQFVGKKILLNCDDPETSMFWKYFELNFDQLQLEKLTSTHYDPEQPTYKLEMTRGVDVNGDGQMDAYDIVKTPLLGNGDFSSAECIELLKEADIVVTNPPFSLFRDFVTLLMEYDKKFLIIGNKNAITYKEVFPLIKDNKIWVGYKPMGSDMYFMVSDEYKEWLVENKKKNSGYKIIDGEVFGRAQAVWFTNLDVKKRHEPLKIWCDYDPEKYPKYDNYDAIEIGRRDKKGKWKGDVSLIPCDYYGIMGVPITFLDSYCPEQFKIIGHEHDLEGNGGDGVPEGQFIIFGDTGVYKRILIQRVDQPDYNE